MFSIIADLLSLAQHKDTLETQLEAYRIKKCLHCGAGGLWRHGFRYRKSDRENPWEKTENPVPILRLYCRRCRRTCSVLPECIPPRRWYQWFIQSYALVECLAGSSFNKISQKINPSRWTISRWIHHFEDSFLEQALYLKTWDPSLGYYSSFEQFWSILLGKIPLSKAMFRLWASHCPIP